MQCRYDIWFNTRMVVSTSTAVKLSDKPQVQKKEKLFMEVI